MKEYDHLIIGAGMTAEAAAQAIHETTPDASIGMIGSEPQPPYDRPPLSKGLWKDDKEADIFRPLAQTGAELHSGRTAVAINPQARRVRDDQGSEYAYGKLLLATGGNPRRLQIHSDRLIAFRRLDDYHRLRELAQPGAHIAVIGGGFIGSELAASLSANEVKVTMLFPEAAIGARVFSAGLAEYLTGYFAKRGVDVRPGRLVKGGEDKDGKLVLQLDDGSTLSVDGAVAGLGITPNTELAAAAGARIDNGIVVDNCMRTSLPDIFAAGDVAAIPSKVLGKLRRVEHENCAVTTGHHAGLAMAGQPRPYEELPFFYSDLFDLGYEAVGDLDARLDIFEDWREPWRDGVTYYLDNGRVRGVLLWNTWDRVDAARELIAEPGHHDADNLRQRITG